MNFYAIDSLMTRSWELQVPVFLFPNFGVNTYISGHMVDHGCDTPVQSFVVHSLNIGIQVGSSYEGRQALFLIFLSNMPFVSRILEE